MVKRGRSEHSSIESKKATDECNLLNCIGKHGFTGNYVSSLVKPTHYYMVFGKNYCTLNICTAFLLKCTSTIMKDFRTIYILHKFMSIKTFCSLLYIVPIISSHLHQSLATRQGLAGPSNPFTLTYKLSSSSPFCSFPLFV